MDKGIRSRMDMIELLAKSDKEYTRMLQQLRVLEREYDKVLQTLPYDQRDVVCDFVSQCEEMSWRVLELACTHMCFPE